MEKKKDESAVTTPINEGDGSSDRLSLLKSRLKIAKAFSKKPHAAWKKWLAEYKIDDLGDTKEVRDKVRIGYIFRKTESELPAIFDDQPDLFIKGRRKGMKDVEPIFNSLYDYLWDVQRLEDKIEDAGLYFILTGMAFISSPYVTKNETVQEVQDVPMTDPATGQPVMDQMGQPITTQQEVSYERPVIDHPLAEVQDPFKIYFSPETKFAITLDYDHCPYYFKEMTMTQDAIEAEYGKKVDAGEKLHTEDTEIDTEISNEMQTQGDDLKRVTVYEYYGVLPKDMAPKGTEWKYDKDYHVIFTNNEELKSEESQYETKPCFVLGNYGPANEFWKFGDAKHLIPLVQELEQYRSQILTHTRKMANPKPLIEMSSEVDETMFSDPRVGKTVKYAGTPPTYLSPAPLGREVQVGVDMARTDLEKTSPSFDLNQGGGQSQVKSPRGIQVYSEASDKATRRKRKKVGRLIRELLVFQFKQIAQNWNPEDGKKLDDELVTPEMLQIIGDPDILRYIDIEIESLSVNRVQMKQDALELFDLAAQHPDLFNLPEMARDLLQNGYNKRDADRYLISMAEQGQMAIQQFIQALSQISPELAAQVMQAANQPNFTQLMAGGNPAEQGGQPGQPPQLGQGPSQPQQSTNGMEPMPPM